MGAPCDKTIYLSHASLSLPHPNRQRYVEVASRLGKIITFCRAGKYGEAGAIINSVRKKNHYSPLGYRDLI